jgi:dihydroorotate dehydrogenase
MQMTQTRRRFLAACSMSAVALLLSKRTGLATPPSPHPEPRPGITGSNVLKADKLGGDRKLVELFDAVREIPQIADGIRCNCGCPNPPEFRSLLSCFEGKGMAKDCVVCQGQARLAVRLHKEGKTLDQIRQAIDARFA